MRIGVISDTHDQVHWLPPALDLLKGQAIEALIHCGDWISPFTLNYYKVLDVPLFGVYGNNDGDKFLHQRVAQRIGLNLTMDDVLLTLELDGKRMAVYHGTAPLIVTALAKCGDYDVVCYGHNHLAKIERVGPTLTFNPGTLMEKTSEAIQGASVGVYDTTTDMAELFWLSR